MQVKQYVRVDGVSPYARWLDTLDCRAAAKMDTAVVRMALGNTSRIKWFDGVGEYRIDWGPGYRIYLGQDGPSLIILLGGGAKNTQRQDILLARALWADYKVRKATEADKSDIPGRS